MCPLQYRYCECRDFWPNGIFLHREKIRNTQTEQKDSKFKTWVMWKYEAVTLWYNLSLACITWDQMCIFYIFYYVILQYRLIQLFSELWTDFLQCIFCTFLPFCRGKEKEDNWQGTHSSMASLYMQVRALTRAVFGQCVRSSIQCMSRVTNANNSICWI